jgi:predicted transcriptional regulator
LSSVLHGPERKKIPVSDKYNPLKNEIFLPIPLKIAQRKDLKNLSKLVYGYLLKCFGKNDLACPKMAEIAKDLNVSRQIVSKCITELKTKDLIKICKTGKASRYEFIDVNTVLTSDVNTVLTSDVNTALTSPIIKRKNKRKNKKLGATPDSFSNSQLPKWENGNSQLPGNPDIRCEGSSNHDPQIWHPYIDEIMAAMPKQAKGKISRAFINEHLKKKGGDRPYFYWVFENATDKPDPVKWITMGIRGYYGAYLKSDEYKTTGDIGGYEMMTPLNYRD